MTWLSSGKSKRNLQFFPVFFSRVGTAGAVGLWWWIAVWQDEEQQSCLSELSQLCPFLPHTLGHYWWFWWMKTDTSKPVVDQNYLMAIRLCEAIWTGGIWGRHCGANHDCRKFFEYLLIALVSKVTGYCSCSIFVGTCSLKASSVMRKKSLEGSVLWDEVTWSRIGLRYLQSVSVLLMEDSTKYFDIFGHLHFETAESLPLWEQQRWFHFTLQQVNLSFSLLAL